MRTRHRFLPSTALVALAAGAVALTAAPATAAPDRSAGREAELERALDRVVAAGAPGAIALVREGDRTIRVASGYGNLAARTPMRTGDRFRVGSVTKTFVATVVLQLVDERRLALEDTVERWVPGLVANGGAITLRQLLNHTSGLFDYTEDPRVRGPVVRGDVTRAAAPRRLVEIATSHAPLFAPGARWSYSNTGYILLGLVVEAATGQALGTELRERIFEPLGLRATSLPAGARITGRHAHGYARLGRRRPQDVSLLGPSWAWAAGAMVSTVSDLARFYRALLGGRLLRADLLRAMETTVPVTPRQQYGLGLFTTRWRCGVAWGHGGDMPGYWTLAQNSRDGGRQVVLALNASDESLSGRAQDARQRFLRAAVCGSAAPAPASAGGVSPMLGPCPGAAELPVRARCGSIAVPLDRANPSLGTTQVAFALVPRREASRPSLGTIVPNPGGPGVAAIGGPEAQFAELFAPLLERRDLLLVDPRGTGRSDELACSALAEPGLVFGAPDRFVAAIGACGRELGPRVGLYGSAAVADDIEAVRDLLDLERLDLWGSSYGTYLMPVFAARHPVHVRSLVLSGAGPIDFDPWGRDRLGAARRAIRLVCARTGVCRGRAVLRDLARLAKRLRAHPVSFRVAAGARRFRARLDESALAAVVFAGGDATAYGRIPAAVASALDGDPAPLRRLVTDDLLELAAILRQPFFSLAQNFATACHDYPRAFSYAVPPSERIAAYERALATIDPRAFRPFSRSGWALTGQAGGACLEWPNDPTATSPLPPGMPLPDVPVLVLSGDLDANTPSAGGRRAAARFRRATFVEIPNSGHTPAASSACAVSLALRFIVTLDARPRACAGTGAPPPVAGRAPRDAAGLALVLATGATRAERRALAVAVATAGDLVAQAGILEAWSVARALRGGSYAVRRDGTIGLREVRVVRDARVSGGLALVDGERLEGILRLAGRGIPDGRLRMRLASDGGGRARGFLDGRPVDLAFRTEE